MTRPAATWLSASIPDRSTAAILFALAALVFVLRVPDTLLNAQFIAEDGNVYFLDQFGHFLPRLLTPAAGYLVVLPRLIAWVASPLPTLYLPLAYALATHLVAAACVAYFCLRARAVFAPSASFVAVVALPMLSFELYGILANLQWFGQLVIVAACLLPTVPGAESMSRWARCGRLLILAAVALTGPYAIICALVYFGLVAATWGLKQLRFSSAHGILADYLESLDVEAAAIVVIAGLVSIIVVASGDVVPSGQHPSLVELLQTGGGEGLQVHTVGAIYLQKSTFLIVLAVLLVLFLVMHAPSVGTGCLILLGYGWLCLLIGYIKMKGVAMADRDINYIDRYVFALAVFEWLVVARIVGTLVGRAVAGTCVIAVLLLAIGLHNPARITRPPPPDLDWPAYARRIDAGNEVVVPINPRGWSIHVPARGKPN